MAAILAAIALAACDPAWAIVFENESDQAAHIRVDTRPFNGDDTFSTDFLVEPGTRIRVGSNGVGSLGQVVRVSLLDGSCTIVASEPVIGFDEGGVVELRSDGRLWLTAGENPIADHTAAASNACT